MTEMKKEIEILENALSGALLVPNECAFVNTQVIKVCLDTLKTYESWENLIRYEIEKEIRADERAKVIDEFVNALINPSNYERYDFDECLDDSNKANDFFKYVFAMTDELKEQSNEHRD